MEKYLTSNKTRCKLLAMEDIQKECGKNKFYSKNFLYRPYLLKILSEIDRSYIQIK